jgi:[ribosomal protein S18]-alanine N-acetyltransferase
VIGLEIRPATVDDLDAVVTLEARVFGEDAWSPRSVEAEFAAIGHTRVIEVGEIAGQVVAYAVLMYVGDTGDVQRIGVDAARRQRGVGRSLMRRIFRIARDLGLSELLLEVAEDNLPATLFYERLGFATIDRRAAYYPSGRAAVVMRRRLRAVSDA